MVSTILWIHRLFSYWYSNQRLHLKDPHAPIAQPPFLDPATNPIMSERIETHNQMPKLLTLSIVGRKIPLYALGEDEGRLWTAISCLRIEVALLCMIGRRCLKDVIQVIYQGGVGVHSEEPLGAFASYRCILIIMITFSRDWWRIVNINILLTFGIWKYPPFLLHTCHSYTLLSIWSQYLLSGTVS